MTTKVLFIPENEPALRELLLFVQCEAVVGRIDPHFLIIRSLEPNSLRIRRESPDSGRIHWINESAYRRFDPIEFFWRLVQRTIPLDRFKFAYLSRRLLGWRRIAAAILDRYDPRALVITSDRAISLALAVTCVARERGLRSLIAPVALSSAVGPSAYRGFKSEYQLRVDRAEELEFIQRFPRLVRSSRRFGSQLFYPLWMARALAQAALFPKNPWGLGASLASRVCVPTVDDVSRLEEDGVEGNRIVVTGVASHDSLAVAIRNRNELRFSLRAEMNLADRPIVVLAVPQFAEHGLMDWDRHWKELTELAEGASGDDFELLLSLHPKSDPVLYADKMGSFGKRILRRPLREALVAADVFVSVYSSTIDWAILAGIPAICVDFYGFNYPLFEQTDGVVKVRDRDLLGPALRSALQGGSREVSSSLDGHSSERILGEILRLVE